MLLLDQPPDPPPTTSLADLTDSSVARYCIFILQAARYLVPLSPRPGAGPGRKAVNQNSCFAETFSPVRSNSHPHRIIYGAACMIEESKDTAVSLSETPRLYLVGWTGLCPIGVSCSSKSCQAQTYRQAALSERRSKTSRISTMLE